ncbi:hypothetical protein AMTR_s00023p00048860 [Amborella trichopoda]|uniref:Uncharacterized protein n=1 Tax=Amborella trichopoda TaxID=13333 RepID=W1NJY5_AMBTC|nr:hypothetical protein AMTR_s00023p00048860 [Amborella trichopoda]
MGVEIVTLEEQAGRSETAVIQLGEHRWWGTARLRGSSYDWGRGHKGEIGVFWGIEASAEVKKTRTLYRPGEKSEGPKARSGREEGKERGSQRGLGGREEARQRREEPYKGRRRVCRGQNNRASNGRGGRRQG